MAKTKKKDAVKKRRKQCSIKGCRKMRMEGSLVCKDHQAAMRGQLDEQPPDPVAVTKRLSEMERLRFNELDTALRNVELEAKNTEQEAHIDKLDYERRCEVRRLRLRQLKQVMQVKSHEQKLLLGELAKKYGFDPATVSIDDTSGIIHEHKQE